jgi:hypothetical protein
MRVMGDTRLSIVKHSADMPSHDRQETEAAFLSFGNGMISAEV